MKVKEVNMDWQRANARYAYWVLSVESAPMCLAIVILDAMQHFTQCVTFFKALNTLKVHVLYLNVAIRRISIDYSHSLQNLNKTEPGSQVHLVPIFYFIPDVFVDRWGADVGKIRWSFLYSDHVKSFSIQDRRRQGKSIYYFSIELTRLLIRSIKSCCHSDARESFNRSFAWNIEGNDVIYCYLNQQLFEQ
jgi:hypothetical protein